MDLYRDLILDHYHNPRNAGTLPSPAVSASSYNATCGDMITIQILFGSKQGKKVIKDIRFSGDGCAISQASASLLTEKIKKMDTESVLNISADDILKLLQTTLTPARLKCALLPLEVVQKAIIQNPVIAKKK